MAKLDRVVSVKGLIPALDRRQVADPFVMDGENFLVDAEGPYSAFGGELLVNKPMGEFLGCQTFHVENNTVVATKSAFMVFDTTSLRFYPIFTFTALTDNWVWSMAKVGGSYYFAHKGANLIAYNPLTLTWTNITTNVPTSPRAVTQAGGRLIVLGIDAVGWSAIDVGTDLATSTATGAGQQSLSIIGSGDGLRVLETNDGFITYTKSGLMKSELVDAVNPFRHYRLITENHPLSPYAISYVGTRTHVYVTTTGFYSTKGSEPEIWQPVISEHFARNLLPYIDLEDTRRIKLTFMEDINQIFISLSSGSFPDYYTEAYVLYIPSNQFGKFNRRHTALGHFALASDPDRGFIYGYVDEAGYVFKFSTAPIIETIIEEISGNYMYRAPVEIPCWEINGVVQANSFAKIACVDESVFNNVSNYYATTDFVTIANIQRQFGSIDSYIDVGLFHIEDVQYEDFLINVSDVTVGMGELPFGSNVIDLMTSLSPDEDWMVMAGGVDWGIGVVADVIYDVDAVGSVDGYDQWKDEIETLIAVNTIGRMTQYAANVNGKYGILKFRAQDYGKSFHLKLLGVTASLTGRL